jgi:hypothetical protein
LAVLPADTKGFDNTSASDRDEGTAVPAAAAAVAVEEAPVVGAAPADPAASSVQAAHVAAATPEAVPAALAVQAEPGAALPAVPTREDVTQGFEKVRGAVAQCAAGKHGIVTITATIAGSGRLMSALVDGVFKGTPEGSCMARAARGTSFPPFSQGNLKVSYPMSI